ncbi:MAG: BatD family protein [Gammaproteobacteria bacterium]
MLLAAFHSLLNRFCFKALRLLCLITVLGNGVAVAAEIVASVDRNPVNLNESFQIVFSASESPDEDPDFGPLEEDFEILNRSQSSSTSIINGEFNKTIQWKLNVMAKRAGSLMIPSIAFGDDSSQPLSLRVMQGNSSPAIRNEDELFLEVEASQDKPYVQSQVLYTLRFYRRVSIAQASLNEPEVEDALIEKLGEDSSFNTQIDGVNYQVTERKYAIFPQKSGILTIPPLTLTAEVVSSGRSRFDGFFNRQITRMKRVTSKAVTLEVQPVPSELSDQHWLPAEGLNLSQEWSGDITQMKVGEPLTRTLTILAKGATVGQLPELNTAPQEDQLKIYPDQPVLKEDKKPEGLLSYRQEKIAFIPAKAGRYTLPAIEVPWFNTRTGQLEHARIPETTLVAIAGGEIKSAQPITSSAPALPLETPASEAPVHEPSNNYWMWIAVILASGWLATVVYFLCRGKAKMPEPQDDSVEISLNDSIKALKKACNENNAQSAKDALINWGRLKFNVSSLGALAPQCDARLRDEIVRLNHCLYGKTTESWQGKRLFQTFVENKAMEQIKTGQDESLEPLYRL